MNHGKMKRISIIFMTIMALCSCVSYNMEEVLLDRSDISLTWKGSLQICYNPEKFQIGFNDTKLEYRVYDDKLTDWFRIKFSEMPSEEGQKVKADVNWTAEKGTRRYQNLELSVKRTDGQGLYWLWNESNKIGIIIKDIR